MVAAFRMHSCNLECKVKLSPTCQVQSFLAAGKISIHLLELRCVLLTSLAIFPWVSSTSQDMSGTLRKDSSND